MFIEKVSEKNIKDYIERYNLSVKEISKKDNHIYVSAWTDHYGPFPEFYLEDFNAKMLNNYQYYNDQVKKDWIGFLGALFGTEYLDALTNHLNDETKKIVNHVMKVKAKKEDKNEF